MQFKDNSLNNIRYSDKSHGFFSNDISRISQDKNGIIWAASSTDGLGKYDGRSIMNYTVLEGLPSDEINDILYESKEKEDSGLAQVPDSRS